MAKTLGLVWCGMGQNWAPALPVSSLYSKSLFRLSFAMAREHCDEVMILSAGYGLLAPDDWVHPYDVEFSKIPPPLLPRWAAQVERRLQRVRPFGKVLVWGGRERVAKFQAIVPHAEAAIPPLQSIGYILQWLKNQVQHPLPPQPWPAPDVLNWLWERRRVSRLELARFLRERESEWARLKDCPMMTVTPTTIEYQRVPLVPFVWPLPKNQDPLKPYEPFK